MYTCSCTDPMGSKIWEIFFHLSVYFPKYFCKSFLSESLGVILLYPIRNNVKSCAYVYIFL